MFNKNPIKFLKTEKELVKDWIYEINNKTIIFFIDKLYKNIDELTNKEDVELVKKL